ncbi:HD domain-containing protein [Gleimia europaea]|uniref:HD domain-containing protein n=1 Tax=Gleimia europaea TaxID=66228 RepID=UPI00277F8B49|nr:hypothetical protein [Gleimia europaea]MDP9833953.1 putative metal-dependent HD superfamily phosphohydrolase [Gleimia europaea]
MAEIGQDLPASAPVPPWLPRTFVSAVLACGVEPSQQVIDEEVHGLLAVWQAADRPYHNVAYLSRVIAAFDQLAAAAHTPELLQIAAWYAGLVPPEVVKCDTADSAEFKASCSHRISDSLTRLGFSPAVCKRVCELIRVVVTHRAPAEDVDATTLLDATQRDLSATPQEYKQYRGLLRQEFPNLSDLQFWNARRRFVSSMLSRPQIYLSPGGAAWEVSARQNLEAELANLDTLIAQADPGACFEDEPEQEFDPLTTTSTMIIKKIGAKNDPIIMRKDDFEEEISAERPEATPPVEDAPEPEQDDASSLEDDGASSLEDEPDVIARPVQRSVRRLSAKELARLARTRAEQVHEDAFTAEDASRLRERLDKTVADGGKLRERIQEKREDISRLRQRLSDRDQ